MGLESTLEYIANYGPDAFYEGEMGKLRHFRHLLGWVGMC